MSATNAPRAVVVGASHAGAQLAAGLRQEGWAGEILLVGDETTLPYQRPPLSKAYLSGKSTLDELAIRNNDYYVKQRIERLQAMVDAIDPTRRELRLTSGDSIRYDKLALCTGARPRKLPVPGADLDGVYYLRTAADAALIRDAATPGKRAVIIGGGYIGLETAASLRTQGLEVTVLEAADRVLARVTAPEVSAFFTRIHRNEGIDIRTGTLVTGLAGNTQVRAVILASSESIAADLVVVGIGVEPDTTLAVTAGLAIDDGVLIDSQALTSNPDIVAAGDCTRMITTRWGHKIRLESVPNATEQAKVAAATICGNSKQISALPWFWSDQFDLKMQIAGLNTGYDEIVLDGDPDRDRDFSCYYLRHGNLIAADCINRPRDFMFSKRAISQVTPTRRGDLVGVAS